MPVVFVHGVPETAAIWDLLVAELDLGDAAIRLSPPGFGAPAAADFTATSDAYRDWLIAELEQLGGPVDLVGHDWGAGHAVRVMTARPDLVRSWCIDLAGVFDPAYAWHDLAQVWQQPGAGEKLVNDLFVAPPVADRVTGLVGLGMRPEAARSCAEAAGPEMARCILALYRSAGQPALTQWGAEWEAAARRPGLVLVPAEDTFAGAPELAHRTAARLGAATAELPGLGHWWMQQDPAPGARALSAFLAGVRG
jgi:pimeloyl-ACP methyl ester carboxylesterase